MYINKYIYIFITIKGRDQAEPTGRIPPRGRAGGFGVSGGSFKGTYKGSIRDLQGV